jgi:phosphoesterase RecJ-like protein
MIEENLFQQIRTFINTYEHFLILGHEEPDGDCVGSELALVHWLERHGKRAQAFAVGAFEKLEIMAYKNIFKTSISQTDLTSQTALIIVDCSGLGRTGLAHELPASLPCLIIDHHAEGSNEGDIRLIEPLSPSTTLLILKLIEAYGEQPDLYEAELLLLGFCTDTGYFRHLSEQNSSEALAAVSRLTKVGASLQAIYARIYWGKELKQAKLLGWLLTRVESYADQKILYTWQSLSDYEENTAKLRVTEDLYRYLQAIKNNEVIVFIKEKSATECMVSLRSTNTFNVGKIAHSLGGGGHRNAAGLMLPGTLAQVKAKILQELSRFYDLPL